MEVHERDAYFCDVLETEEAKYIFRVYRADRRRISEIKFELDLLKELHVKGVNVSIPIAKKDGTFINEFLVSEGMKYGVMFSFAEGDEKPIQTIEDSYLFGQAAARIHHAADSFSSKHEREILNLEYLIVKPLHNASFTEDGKLTHYDFDICGYGWRAYDIAEFRLAREIHSRHNKDEVEQLWEAFLNGYRDIRHFSENDLKAVPIFVVLRQFWLFGLCFSEAELIGEADFDNGFIDSKMDYFRNVDCV
ncbi:Ser/Thr protein kinase RdoA involved in Cpx stress response, MazF antagonist [Paenibacillus algorifonticola]|uniref:Ser/Thr protein kinase RdoA involved in Cpx stress response, MazF antagonist n=1 Tax=Paenibacillus algorifonticola TaxID=684063 RepID=A0A1I2FAA3_9BACL|nr:hypothetical protein [Paenibacillus algorifonticola]SFF02135.1 Ser/Thr protein kinase RdoA involved in Cpx stress response, MazF antagonist [Paenibacillus algorifonticola]